MKQEKFTIKDFEARHPDDEACLQQIFEQRYAKFNICPYCKKPFKYHKVSNRKCYSCQFCGHQLHPLADTIFHKSSTSLKNWFYVIYLFSVSKNGVSAKELERQLGVTYKCAWRIAKQVRALFEDENPDPLNKIVEIDETYIGGKRTGKRGRGAEGKTPVFGIVERDGEIRACVVSDTKSSTVRPLIKKSVLVGCEVMTDEYLSYSKLAHDGYIHQTVKHGAKEYARGNVHTNTIEGFWSQLKRSIDGTYHAVSPKYLQNYVNEFSFRYNHRKNVTPLFHKLVDKIV